MNNKYIRYFFGFFLFTLILLAFYFSKIMIFILSVFFIITAMIEYRKMFQNRNIFPHKILPEFTGILCAYIFTFEHDITNHTLITPILLFGIIFSFILTIILKKKPYIMTSLSTIASILFIFCGLYIIKLTYYFEDNTSWYLISVYFIAILLGDFAASIIGQKIKTSFLSQEISPNKTKAGAIANLLTSCIICLSLTKLLSFSIFQSLILGIIISVFAQFGDLTISSFKRDLELKHSGNLFFNYGGFLDRMDSFIFSAPAAYYCLFILTII